MRLGLMTYQPLSFCLAIICCSLFSLSTQAQVAASARVDKQNILIGDQIKLELQITYPQGQNLIAINDADLKAVEELEVITASRVDTISRDPQYLLQQNFVITSFDSGYHYIPPFEILFQATGGIDTTRTNPIPIEVRTIPIDEQSELANIKPIIEEPTKFSDFLPYLIGGAVLTILALIIWGLRQRRSKIGPPPPPPIPPHELAVQRLKDLDQKQLWQNGNIKSFQSELTYILRDYLEGRYQLPALESTTGEIDRSMKKLGDLGEWREELIQLLHTADLVKFAKSIPPLETHQQAMDTVERFVEETKPQPEPEIPDQEEEKHEEEKQAEDDLDN